MDFNLSIGMTAEKTEPVTKDNTAIKFGSGTVAVYATPAMVGLMEGACVAAVGPLLPETMSTVGIDLNVRHLAPTPVGMSVRAVAELTEIDGKRLLFRVAAFDNKEQIGSGTHERYIVDIGKFSQNAEAKLKELFS